MKIITQCQCCGKKQYSENPETVCQPCFNNIVGGRR